MRAARGLLLATLWFAVLWLCVWTEQQNVYKLWHPTAGYAMPRTEGPATMRPLSAVSSWLFAAGAVPAAPHHLPALTSRHPPLLGSPNHPLLRPTVHKPAGRLSESHPGTAVRAMAQLHKPIRQNAALRLAGLMPELATSWGTVFMCTAFALVGGLWAWLRRPAPPPSLVVLNVVAEQPPWFLNGSVDCKALRTSELSRLLKTLGMKHTGSREELVARLEASQANGSIAPEASAPSTKGQRAGSRARSALVTKVVQSPGLPTVDATAQRDLGQAVALFGSLQAKGKRLIQAGHSLLFHLAGGRQWEDLIATNVARTSPRSSGVSDGGEPPVPGEASARHCAEKVFESLMAIEPTDTTVALMARVYASTGDLQQVETFLSATADSAVTARSYHPLLTGMAARGDVSDALRIFDLMLERHVRVGSAEVALLLEAASHAAVPQEWAEEVLRRASSVLYGPITPDILHGLEEFFSRQDNCEVRMVTVEEGGRFTVDDSEFSLQLRPLDAADVREARESVKAVVEGRLSGSGLRTFLMKNPLCDVVIDGSSIGSRGPNSDPANVGNGRSVIACKPIQAVLNAAEQLGFRHPLVLLPRRFTQRLPPTESEWMERLAQLNQLFKTPKIHKVDWSVTYASLLINVPYITRDARQADLRHLLPRPECFDRWKDARRILATMTTANDVALHPPLPYSVVPQQFEQGWMVPLSHRHWLQILWC